MRLLTILLLCQLLTVPAFSQIDTLRHRSSIEAYVKARGGYTCVELLAVNSVLRDSAVVAAPVPAYWVRADFNHDGAEDLLVRATISRKSAALAHDESLVLTGGINPQLVRLDNWFSLSSAGRRHKAVTPVTVANKVYLVYSMAETIELRWKRLHQFSQDTLYVRANRPMPFTSHPAPTAPITRISYATTTCFGSCPAFRVRIKPNGVVDYIGEGYARPQGKYRLRMSAADFSYLAELLRNLNLPNLADWYRVRWSDHPTCTLDVTFADDRITRIEDYGMQGSYGLAILYQFLWQQYQPRYAYP